MNPHDSEKWEYLKPGRCHACHESDQLSMFEVCEGNCSYAELLYSLDEGHGAIVEILNERGQVQRMLDNIQRWMNNPRVLHISMEHLKADYDKTLSCINSFLGPLGFPEEQLDHFRLLKANKANNHTTSGKYDNSNIIKMLEQEPVWGAEFVATREAMSKIYKRQADVFDCPVF